jgi:hypothetical protein
MLPKRFKLWLFDRLSIKTMRYVSAVPRSKATGLVAELYDQFDEDFFVNGSLTSRSRVPNLLAAIWVAGRETIIVDDWLPRTFKEAVAAVVSDVNDCPYCGEMLISLVHAGNEHDTAESIFTGALAEIEDPVWRERLTWVHNLADPNSENPGLSPFPRAVLPELIGSMVAMSDINRFSHVTMDGSPVSAPTGLRHFALRMFGIELVSTKQTSAVPGTSLRLLRDTPVPPDLFWAKSNPRVQTALARWFDTVDCETRSVIPEPVRRRVLSSLSLWNNEPMPISRSWVDDEVAGLPPAHRALAKLILIVAKASYQFTEDLLEDACLIDDEDRLVRVLAFASASAARRLASIYANAAGLTLAAPVSEVA